MKLQRTKTGIGLDLGHYRLKALEAEWSPSGWRVVKHASVATPKDSIKDGVVVDAPAVAHALKDMFKEFRIGGSHVSLAAAGGAVFVRHVQFPKMNEATLRKTIRFEASRYVPGHVEDSLVDFSVASVADDQMNVLVVAAPKDIVESRIKAVNSAGLEVEAVDVEAFATYRALIETQENPEIGSTIALVDIGSASTSVSVVHEGQFAMNRSIPYGGNLLTDALKGYFKISAEDAEEGKAQLNLKDLITNEGPKENPPLRVIQPHVDDLVREIRRSLNYFQSQSVEGQTGRKVESIVLAGGGAKLPGIEVYFAQKLGLPVSLLGLYDNPKVSQAEPDGGRGLDFTVAGGLAMRAGLKAA